MPDRDVVTIVEQDVSYRIFLPDRSTDYIQKKIFETEIPYELDMLRDMASRISAGDLVLDVGANIGNHSLYLAAICHCQVVSFEPNAHLADALRYSASLNGLSEQMTIHPTGVGATSAHASFAELQPDNLGSQRLILDQGDIRVIALDQLPTLKNVRMIKIDVEGMELEVLRGAKKIIARDRPILYIESSTETELNDIRDFLKDQKFHIWDSFNATPTHLFVPEESVTSEHYLEHLKNITSGSTFEIYRKNTTISELRSSLHQANLKYRTVCEQVAKSHNEIQVRAARLAEVEMKYDSISEQLAEVQNDNKARAADLAEARWSLRMLQSQLRDARAQAEEAEKRTIAAESKLASLIGRTQLPAAIPAVRSESAVSQIPPQIVSTWLQALPLPTETIAQRLLDLALQIRGFFPDQALALLQTVHELTPSERHARCLMVALLEHGRGQDALALLNQYPDNANLSSRATRLLDLARQGLDGEALRTAQVTRSRLRVAAIMDEFTATGYGPECDLQQLPVTGWKETLEDFQPELLLIESAWRGLDEQWGAKVGQLSEEVLGILDWCKARGIPTAFWNKEDPVHFETFLTTAQKFDHVFTTDIDCIPRYKSGLGHDRVYLLPFACQPEIHNPLEITERKKAFCFAGAYYVRYPDRTRDLDSFLKELTQYRSFEIYDRNHGKDHPDYLFPEAYRKYIVGTLTPSEIDWAYKGYEFGINLNSVKNSQSMFARRVYELLASNTRVVSNYSPGLRLMFGDLVISTDSGAEALRRIRKQDSEDIAERVRLAGLRKAMSEHTYSHRVTRIACAAGIETQDASALPPVTVLAGAASRAEAKGLIAQGRRQSLSGLRMVLVTPKEELAGLNIPDWVHCLTPKDAAATRLRDLAEPGSWLAGFVAADYYGAHYLKDMILATRYSSAHVFGKASYHRLNTDSVERIAGPAYSPVDRLAARRAMIRAERAPAVMLQDWLHELPNKILSDDNMLSLDAFSYCEAGAKAPGEDAAVTVAVEDLPKFSYGISNDELSAYADAMAPAPAVELPAAFISGSTLVSDMSQPQSGKVVWASDEQGALTLTSTLGSEEHLYLYEKTSRPLAELAGPDGAYRLHPLTGPGLNILFVAVWHDAKMQKLGHQILAASRNAQLTPPEGTAFVRFGMRPRGPGSCTLTGLVLDDHHPAPRQIMTKSRVLLLTNHYPSWQDLYRNGFVHSRVRAYREHGITPDIYRLRADQDLTWHEFQNIDCMTGSAEQLDYLLASGQYDHVLVHFLDADMWQVLSRHINQVRVTVWVHGAEVQPWWRRAFNYSSDADLEIAKALSDQRLTFWRSLFAPLPKNLYFVFVSKYFAEEVFEDLQVTCTPDQYQIIHNPIDDELFKWLEKPAEQRRKILSIRPFASKVYANDLTVEAILSLRSQDFFEELEFHIIGDGPLFDEVTRPLTSLRNVTCERRFLTQAEIADIHKDYGIFLVPSRMDTQGVSRDEAMSSGLVPITNRVAAIPEFVNDSCGYLAEPEDAEGLARAIVDVWNNPDTFLRKSRAAAEWVRRQRGKNRIIMAEIEILRQAEFHEPSE